METTTAIDAALYSYLHQLLDAYQTDDNVDRRDSKRRMYTCVQLVAPYTPGRPVTQAEFRHVRCHDLSAGGFSFYSTRPPQTEQLVAALGPAPFRFVQAKVVRQTQLIDRGRIKYVIGCQFLGPFEG